MTDTELINSLGGPTKVADLLKLQGAGRVQRVQNWFSRGIPSKVKVDHPEIFMRAEPLAASDDDVSKPLDELMAQAAQAGLIERRKSVTTSSTAVV